MGAQGSALPPDDVEELITLTNYNAQDLQRAYESFNSVERKEKDRLNKDEFAQALGFLGDCNQSVMADILFKHFDRQGNGYVSLKDFLTSMSVMMKGDVKTKLEFGFRLLDADGDGFISKVELYLMVQSIYGILSQLFEGNSIVGYGDLVKQQQRVAQFVDTFFEKFDTDKDEKISFEEYCKAAEEQPDMLLTLGLVSSKSNISFVQNPNSPSASKRMWFGTNKFDLMVSIMIGIRTSVGQLENINNSTCNVSNSPTLSHSSNKTATNGSKSNLTVPPSSSSSISFSPRTAEACASSLEPKDFIAETVAEINGRGATRHRWIDYAPRVFQSIRRDICGVSDEEYVISLGPEQMLGNILLGNLSSLAASISEGKSGSLFFFSPDGKFLVKTISSDEKRLLISMLPSYYRHLKDNPNTLLNKFLGLHKLVIGNRRTNTLRLLVLENVFATTKKVHYKYDLKGSTYGRKTKEGTGASTLKDLDFNRRILLGSTRKKELMEQIKADCKFLVENSIMDYSILVGIHDTKYGITKSAEIRSLPSRKQQRPQFSSLRGEELSQSEAQKERMLKQLKEASATLPVRNCFEEAHLPAAHSATVGDDSPSSSLSSSSSSSSSSRRKKHTRGLSLDAAVDKTIQKVIRENKSSNNIEKEKEKAKEKEKSTTNQRRNHSKTSASLIAEKTESVDSNNNGSNKKEEDETGTNSNNKRKKKEAINARRELTSSILFYRNLRQGAERMISSTDEEEEEGKEKEKEKAEAKKEEEKEKEKKKSTTGKKGTERKKSFDEDKKTASASSPSSSSPLSKKYVSTFCKDDGGMIGSSPEDHIYYFVGIIDILIAYNVRKKGEHAIKSITQDSKAISAVPPDAYAKRFMDFIESIID